MTQDNGPDETPTVHVGFFPEWGRNWPLWGVGRHGLPGMSDDLAERLREWSRVWQEDLDPMFGVRWGDPERGRAWIREGWALVAEVQDLVRGQGLRVIADFEMYAPPEEP